jgi:hypothetical protein
VDTVSLALPAQGGCQCGAIRYRLTGEPVFLTLCHCRECKRQSGSAFGMSLRMRWADVEVTGAKPKTWTRSSDNGNPVACSFCETCGTRLWHEPAVPGFVHIKPGTLDDFSTLAPKYESWTASKAKWLHFEGIEASFDRMPEAGKREAK